jgi:hypothetical protein
MLSLPPQLLRALSPQAQVGSADELPPLAASNEQ